MRTVVRVSGNVLFIVVLLIMAVFTFYLVKGKLAGDGMPNVAGYRLMVVLSGSMSPTFDAGSVVAVKPIAPEQVKEGDIITYRGTESGGTLVTHRVIEIKKEKRGMNFVTKGDANHTPDPTPVAAGNVVGRVVFSVPYAGYVVTFAQSKQGLLVLIIIPAVLIGAMEIRNIWRYLKESERQTNEGEVNSQAKG